MLRRIETKTSKQAVSYDGLYLDPGAHAARRDGTNLDLTPTEFDLLVAAFVVNEILFLLHVPVAADHCADVVAVT